MIYVLHAHDAKGNRHELSGVATDPTEARRMADRAARLLSAVGTPGGWAGGRVAAVEADTGRLVTVARVHHRARASA